MNSCKKEKYQVKLLLCSMQVKEWFLCSLQISTILIFHYLVDIYVVISSAKEAYKIKKWLYYMRFFIHVRAAHNPKVVSSNLAPATRNSYLKDNWEQEKHAVSVLYRGCVLFYCLFYGTHRMTEIYPVPLPYPYRFSVRVFFELLRKRKYLKNTLLSTVFKKFTNRKGYTNICFVSFSISFLINRLSKFVGFF